MSKKSEKEDYKIQLTTNLVGDWAPLIGDIFYWEEVKKFSNELKKMKALPFEDVYGDSDYFKYFKETPLEKIKVVYVKEYNDSFDQQLREIELDIFDGFSLNVSSEKDVSWLHIQGVMVFPRYYTWGSSSIFHKQWSIITDNILKRLVQNKYICVCTSNPEIINLVEGSNSATKIIGQGPGCWKKINDFIKNDLKETVKWNPEK